MCAFERREKKRKEKKTQHIRKTERQKEKETQIERREKETKRERERERERACTESSCAEGSGAVITQSQKNVANVWHATMIFCFISPNMLTDAKPQLQLIHLKLILTGNKNVKESSLASIRARNEKQQCRGN